jgi:hypothetical protein
VDISVRPYNAPVKRLLRILRIFFTILCLILFIATAAGWFRSQTNLDEFNMYRPYFYRSIWSVDGRIYLHLWSARQQYWGESSISFGGGRLTSLKYGHVPFSHQLGPFAYGRANATNPAFVIATGHTIMFPHWLLLLLFALPPALSYRRFRRQRFRAANALSLRCGYDIRATPTRCPECGYGIPSAGAGAS